MKGRRAKVFELVTEAYIATAHPVASGHIASQLAVSPATVRYDFGSLESAGLLHQPHTSAGRVPTTLGFRTYAAGFFPPKPLAVRQQEELHRSLMAVEGDDLFAIASRLAADLSGYAVALSLPPDDSLRILEIHLSQLSSNRLLAVVVLENGLVRQLGVTLDPAPDDQVIDDAERNLRQLASPVGEVAAALLQLAKHANDELNRTLVALAQAWHALQPPRVFREGLSRLLSEPEGADPSFMRSALESIEGEQLATDSGRTTAWRQVDSQGAFSDTRFSDTRPESPLLSVHLDEQLARVAAEFSVGRSRGRLHIVGPARMRYPATLSVAQGLALALERPGRA